MTNTIKITKEEFEALAYYPNRVDSERDTEYSYDTILDQDDNEIAFATYHSYEPTSYTKLVRS